MSTDKSSLEASDFSAIIRCVSSRFPSRFYHHYSKWKLQSDPLYAAAFTTLRHQPPLPIIDIGCGIGLLAFFLRECGLSTPLHGLDFDLQKINIARSAAHAYEPMPVFHHGDANHSWPDCRGSVCLLDVLQYLPAHQQMSLLQKSAAHVAPEGLLIIRSGMQSSNWRYRFTIFTDKLMNLIRLMKSPPVTYPTQASLEQMLADQGLRLRDCQPLYERTPFNNYLLVFERSDAGRTH